jgi:sugar phosphate isomerase/epimerase
MAVIALSTMWAQQQRFAADMAPFAEIARNAGFTHIEVSHATDEAGLNSLLRQEVLPLSSLHAPTPLTRDAAGRPNSALNLAATDEEERRAALAAHRRTIAIAAEHGIGYIVVHLGSVSADGLPGERRLRELYQQGIVDGDEVRALREQTRQERAELARAALPQARRSLNDLAAEAAARGVRLGLETRVGYHEIPSLEEALALLAEQDPGTVGYWHDVGHAEVQHRLGLQDRGQWFAVLGQRLFGCHLHDVRGLLDHRAPGRGDVQWAYIARGVAGAAVCTFEIDQHEPEAALAESLLFLQHEGVVPGS